MDRSSATTKFHTRARVICVQCHNRKVRCDLQDSLHKTCSNCHRMNQQCVQRQSLRKSRKGAMRATSVDIQRHDTLQQPERPGQRSIPQQPLDLLPSPCTTDNSSRQGSVGDVFGRDSFIAADSVLSYDFLRRTSGSATLPPSKAQPLTAPLASSEDLGLKYQDQQHSIPRISSRHEKTLVQPWQSVEAVLRSLPTSLPLKEPLHRALFDAFYQHVYTVYPIVGVEELIDPDRNMMPTVLRSAICLAGSLMRRISSTEELGLSSSLYCEVKRLISLQEDGDEEDHVALLKAICLMSCWSLRPPYVVSLAGPWHWTGLAIRLAMQMGLHREETYCRLPDRESLRRVWWHLVASDGLQAACWGRPLMIRSIDMDVLLPTVDSGSDEFKLRHFLYSVHLAQIVRRVIEFDVQDLPAIVAMLHNWTQSLPADLVLYDYNGQRRPYCKSTNQLYIMYFVTIIFAIFRCRPSDNRSRATLLTVVASSCMIRLFEELYHHEQISQLLPINGFFLMLAAIPQIYYHPQTPAKERLREEELSVIRTILAQLRIKYGGCDMVLRKICRLQDEELQGRPSKRLLFDDRQALETWGELPFLSVSRQLFPFPAETFPNLDLLGEEVLGSHEIDLSDLFPVEGSLEEWSFNDPQLWKDVDGFDWP